jgi:hypothetical protein
MAWKEARKSAPPALRTKCDFVLNGREWRKERVEGGGDGEGGELLEVADTLYADDTGEFSALVRTQCKTCHCWSSSWRSLVS